MALSDTAEMNISNKIIPAISAQTKDGKNVKYEYVSGILHVQKGAEGMHSIVIVKSNQRYYEIKDQIITQISSLSSTQLFPKLLFYQKISSLPKTSLRSQTQTDFFQASLPDITTISKERISEKRADVLNTEKKFVQPVSLDRGYSPHPKLGQNLEKIKSLEIQEETSYSKVLLEFP